MSRKEHFYQFHRTYQFDNYLRLYYGENFEKSLEPCEKVRDENLRIGIIDNKNINPRRLMLREHDTELIEVIIPETHKVKVLRYAGKSAFIHLEDESQADKKQARGFVKRILSSTPDRRDNLHLSTVGRIEEAGWQVYWAPLQMSGKLLHVRLVSDKTIKYSEKPSIREAKALVSVFELQD